MSGHCTQGSLAPPSNVLPAFTQRWLVDGEDLPLLSVASVELQKGWSVSWKTVLLPLPKAGFQGHATMEEARGRIKHGVLQL